MHARKRHCSGQLIQRRNIYNNRKYFWSYGYDTSDLNISETCTRIMVGHKKEATQCDPIEDLKIIRLAYGRKD